MCMCVWILKSIAGYAIFILVTAYLSMDFHAGN